jgi:hypothetical protein
MAWLGATQSLHLLRVASTTIALSKGDSLNPTVSNIFRGLSFALAFFFAARGADIVWIAASGLLGEFMAIAVSIGMIRYRLAIPIQYFVKPLIFSLSGLIMATLFWNVGLSKSSPVFAFLAAVALSIGVAALFLLFFTEFRKEISIMIRPLLSRKKPEIS